MNVKQMFVTAAFISLITLGGTATIADENKGRGPAIVEDETGDASDDASPDTKRVWTENAFRYHVLNYLRQIDMSLKEFGGTGLMAPNKANADFYASCMAHCQNEHDFAYCHAICTE